MNNYIKIYLTGLIFLSFSCSVNNFNKIELCKNSISQNINRISLKNESRLNINNKEMNMLVVEYSLNDSIIQSSSELINILSKIIRPKVLSYYKCTESELLKLNIEVIQSFAVFKDVKGGVELNISDLQVLSECQNKALNFIDQFNEKSLSSEVLIDFINPEILIQNDKNELITVLNELRKNVGNFIKYHLNDFEIITFDSEEFGIGYKLIYCVDFTKVEELRFVEFYYIYNKNKLLFNGINILPF